MHQRSHPTGTPGRRTPHRTADDAWELLTDLRARLANKVQLSTSADLAVWNIEAKHPDDFVLDQIGINNRLIWGYVQQIADSRKDRPETVDDVLTQLERSGLVRSVAALRTG